MNTVVIDHVYVGGPSGGSPAPSANIVFALHNPDQSNISIDYNETSVIDIEVDSTIEGIDVPFTIAQSGDWCTITQANNVVHITPQKNTVQSPRSNAITLTQQQMCGSQKTLRISLSQAAGPAVQPDVVLTNDRLIYNDNVGDVIIAYIKNEIETVGGGTIKTVKITDDVAATKWIDPKDLADYELFGTEQTQFSSSNDLTDASVLAFLNIPTIPATAFKNSMKLSKVAVPACCNLVDDSAFESIGTYEVAYHTPITAQLFFLGSTPPVFGSDVFKYAEISSIYIPVGSLSAYQTALAKFGSDIVNKLKEYASLYQLAGVQPCKEFTEDTQTGLYEITANDVLYEDVLAYINS